MSCVSSPAPVACLLGERFGHRSVVMAGGVIICFSLVLTSLMPQLYLFYVTYSVIGGENISLCHFRVSHVVMLIFY